MTTQATHPDQQTLRPDALSPFLTVPFHEVLQGPSYFDPRGPLKKSFRDGDSTWALLSEQELQTTLEQIRTLNEDGGITQYLDEREKRRNRVGQTTFIFARKY